MGMGLVHSASATIPPSTISRLAAAGFELREIADSIPDAAAHPITRALALAARSQMPASVATPVFRERHAVEDDLAAASAAEVEASGSAPVAIVVIPADSGPRPGPVVVVSPAESASAYELYVAAAMAIPGRRRVVHLNGRGTRASAVHSGIAARLLVRAGVAEWREFPHAHPERALHTVASRPAVIVAAVPPQSSAATRLVADHPDADVVLVFDRAHAHLGADVGEQVAAMVEIAFGLGVHTSAPDAEGTVSDDDAADEASVAPPSQPAADPVPELPSIRASDVVHVRLTSDALELTNRTSLRLRLGVSLGAADDPTTERVRFEAVMEPRTEHAEPTAGVAALADLEPPHAVLRHWSHMSEEVYEGGRQRMVAFRVEVLDGEERARAANEYRPGNGLDYVVTARDLSALVGRPAPGIVLPEPATAPASASRVDDVLGALQTALAVGAGILAARSPRA